MTTTRRNLLSAGTRIYYTGDTANSESVGTIDDVYTDKWGTFYDITFDDPRFDGDSQRATRLPAATFLGGVGARFMTIDAYNADRLAGMERMYKAVGREFDPGAFEPIV